MPVSHFKKVSPQQQVSQTLFLLMFYLCGFWFFTQLFFFIFFYFSDYFSFIGIAFGQQHYTCFDFYAPCFSWIVTPSSDPIYLFPPPPQLQLYDTTSDLQQVYLSANLSNVSEKTLVVIIGFDIDNISPLPSNQSQVRLFYPFDFAHSFSLSL